MFADCWFQFWQSDHLKCAKKWQHNTLQNTIQERKFQLVFVIHCAQEKKEQNWKRRAVCMCMTFQYLRHSFVTLKAGPRNAISFLMIGDIVGIFWMFATAFVLVTECKWPTYCCFFKNNLHDDNNHPYFSTVRAHWTVYSGWQWTSVSIPSLSIIYRLCLQIDTGISHRNLRHSFLI